jgi:3-hydroxyisobutyrate dehydrogenase-like beta-hydroxyacid dehydrogenase
MTAVGFLGLGRMGAPMATNLVEAGHDVVVWNRSGEKAERFAAATGARSAATPAQAAADADVVITMLADDAALRSAYEGQCGLLDAIRPGSLAIDMSTISPDTVKDLRAQVGARNASFLDAPVSGSTAAATAATLTVMVGGEPGEFDRARGLLAALGDPILHLGPSGSGAVMKLAVNAIVHSLNGAVSESLVLAERAGIERTRAYEVFVNSAIAAPFVHYRRDTFERPDEVAVAFRLALAAKDLRLALALADAVGASLPQTRCNLDVLDRALDAGLGDRDESAVAVLLRQPGEH